MRFRFDTAWTVPAAPERLRRIVTDLEHYPDWWPQVRAVAKIGPDDARVLCRSTLPYTLDLRLHAVCRDLPTVRVDLAGDLTGWAAWTISRHGAGSRMVFAQEVEAAGVLARLPRIVRPLLVWNHHRMMAGCERGLRAVARAG